jgi:predicted ATPase
MLNEGKSINLSSKQTNTIPSILYFPHHRELLPVTGEQIHREEIKYQWCYRYQNLSSFSGSLESYLIWLDYAEPEIFQSVIDFLNQLDFEGKTFHIHRKTLSVIVKTRDGSEHAFDKLSSGEQNILIMLLELYRRLIPGSIVLLDEIENRLHPAFQHRLAQNLLQLQRQIPFQLILTTHQPAFVKIFGEDCTRILTEF